MLKVYTKEGPPCIQCGSTERYIRYNACAPCARNIGRRRRTGFPKKVKLELQAIDRTVPRRAARLLKLASERSIKRGLEINITKEWIMARLEEGCPVLKIPFVLTAGEGTNPFAPSLDQISPGKGYTVDNCRVVCLIYNYAKSSWTDAEVLNMAEMLVKAQR